MIAVTVDKTSRWRQAFLWALCIAVVIFLPFIIFDKGYFIYYGDFNVQQIPFYKLAHEAVRSGDIFWSWYTDLGVNFIGSYSFYLLFSPFFWLTLPFPTAAVPYLMAPLLILKFACASLTAYLYLERFVRDRAWAVLGGLLYAFSGWMLFNVFFNHFLEVAVFFPLLLLAAEQLVCDGRRGFFALMVCVNALVNYWFFIGEAVFVVLYVIVRMTDKGWPMNFGRFSLIALEAVLGVGLAAIALLPNVLALLGNPRAGTEELLSGWSFWLYWHEQRQPAILQSLFFPPELPARPNFFPDHGAKWSSLSGWLPLFALVGVIAYFMIRKKDWLKKLLALCLVIALVPGFNSLFILLNHSYYARWFYMPVLLMALATIRALEDSRQNTEAFSRAIKWSLVIVCVFVAMSGLTPNEKDGEWRFGMYETSRTFWVYAVLACVCLLLCALLVFYMRGSHLLTRICCAFVAVVTAAFSIFYIANGKNTYERSQFIINTAIRGREYITLPEEPFARADVYDDLDNIAMFWHLPTIQCFHSIVPPSIMEFYPAVGVKRDVGSRPEAEYFALRPLLSVRWLFIQSNKENQSPMPGYTRHSEQVGFNVYENDNYLPMGFAYDSYITRTQMEGIDEKFRGNMMLRAIVLEDEDGWKQLDIIDEFDTQTALRFTAEDMAADVAARRTMTANRFTRDRYGFTAEAELDREAIMFFSVPWDAGWSATVNGLPAEILRANVGFMALRIPPGPVEIRFHYETPGLLVGLYISGASLLLWLGYFLLCRKSAARRKASFADMAARDAGAAALSGAPVRMTLEEYQQRYRDREARRRHLQRTINDAARRIIPDALPENAQTLRFNPGDTANTDREEEKPDDGTQ